MTNEQIQTWITESPVYATLAALGLSVLVYLFARFIVGRVLVYIAKRTKTKYDDIIVEYMRPFRVAWIAPLLVIYFFAHFSGEYQSIVEKTALFLILWVSVLTLTSLFNAFNTIYESSPNFTGVSIQGYLDLVKLLLFAIGIILSISLITGQSLVILLTGLGALTAVLLLVFRDTILSIVASVQIVTNDLIREGDWIEVPSYEADGDVLNISLHTVKVQNFDKTIAVIPTYKMVDVAYKNWRGMVESGGRRIKRSIIIDMNSIKFCDREMLNRVGKIDLIHSYIMEKLDLIEAYRHEHADHIDSPLDGPQVTNVEIFRAYISAYLKNHPDIHQEDLSFLVRSLAPSESGLPIEVYAFARTTAWEPYEKIQAEIFDHLIAAALSFDLRLFQQPTGLDFASFAKG